MLKQLLLDFLTVLLIFDRHQATTAKCREQIGVRNAAETMFMTARKMLINPAQIPQQIVNSG